MKDNGYMDFLIRLANDKIDKNNYLVHIVLWYLITLYPILSKSIMANTEEYNPALNPFVVVKREDDNDAFNAFVDDKQDEPFPSFSGSRLVLHDSRIPTEGNEEETNIVDEVRSRHMQTVQDRSTESTPVLQQPKREEVRKAIPVYTVGWSSTANSQFLAITGLDFLTGVHEVQLQQTVTSLVSPNQVAKRYVIKIPNGETLYSTVENSTEFQRFCFGSQRGFTMSVLDQTRQEAASIVRTIGCVCGWLPCALQELHVYTPANVYLGNIRQDLAFKDCTFTVKERNGQELYRIFGPNAWPWSIPLEAVFVIAGARDGGKLGTIIRRWNTILGDFSLSISFPAPGTPNEQKILLVGAAFLIEYIFYEHRKSSCIRVC